MVNPALAPFAATWGAALWRASWQGGLAILAVWSLCRPVRRMPPAQQCWLWRLAYLKLLIALFWVSPVSLPLLPPAPASPIGADLPDGVLTIDGLPDPMPLRAASQAPELPQYVWMVLLALWGVGCVRCVRQIFREAHESRRLRRGCRVLDDPELLAERNMLARELGIRRTPPLLIHEAVDTPLLIGTWHPAIILPIAFFQDFEPAQRRLVLAHELAHLRRADLWWAWLARSTHCLFFFHPLVWLAEREWLQAQEMACDAQVLQLEEVSAASYGAMLLKVVQPPRSLPSVGLSAMRVAESYATVKRRLIAMKHVGISSRRRLFGAALLIAAAGVIGIVPWRVVAQAASHLHPDDIHAAARESGGFLSAKMIDTLKLSDAQVRKIRAAQAGAQEQINKILTPGQKEQLASLAMIHRNAMEKLALNPEQAAKVERFVAQQEGQLHAIHGDNTLSAVQKEECIKALRTGHEAELKKILTPVQIEKLKTVHKEAQEELKAAPTEEQRQQVAELHAHLQEKATAINNDASLTPEQKDLALKELHAMAEAHMQGIMTDEQRKHRALHHPHDGQVAMSLTGLMNLKTLTPEQKAKIEAAYKNAHKQIEETLTPEQRAKLKEMHGAH